jgi:hypothetical protein
VVVIKNATILDGMPQVNIGISALITTSATFSHSE